MKRIYALTTATLILSLTGCATSGVTESTLMADNSPTAVDVMKNGGTYTYTKSEGPIYANSSAELAERFVGRHVDELPEATSFHQSSWRSKRSHLPERKAHTYATSREESLCAAQRMGST